MTVIVGGGITGLSAAWTLAQAGREVTLIEPGPFGGLLRTEHIDGCTVECGADSWIRAKPWVRNLAVDAGLASEIIPCNEANRGSKILRDGKLADYPRGMRLVAPTEWRPVANSNLIGAATKLRMLAELFRRPASLPDRSASEFIRDHFGDEALEYMAEPLLAGVYGGSPEALSAASVFPKLVEYERTVGSVIRGARSASAVPGPVFESMKGGLGQIPEALVRKLQGRVQLVRAAAERVERGRVRVNGDWISAGHVILACGAAAASQLLAGTAAGETLGRIPHSSATIFAFGFPQSAFASPPAGFGFLVPRKERRTILAATWVTNKFPDRAPADKVVIRCFVAGDYSETLIPAVLADLHRITGIAADPLFSRVYRWPDSLPQYNVGHVQILKELLAVLPAGISVAGAFLSAVGMPDCAHSGAEASTKAMAALERK